MEFGFLEVYGEEEKLNHFIKAQDFSCTDSQQICSELTELLRFLTHPSKASSSSTQMEFTIRLKAANM